uniref:Amino acid transporter n=1 Tax=Ascaris lumbricoides TaxID=6252 RepID=A0A0M3IW28_ASCLU
MKTLRSWEFADRDHVVEAILARIVTRYTISLYNVVIFVIWIASILLQPHSSFTHRVTKAATTELIRSASAELYSEGIRINSVEVKLPSIAVTPGHDASTAANDDGLSVHITRAINAIMFLVSTAATGITGICIPVDGYNDENFIETVTPGHDASTAANDDGLSVHITRAINAIMFLVSTAATGITGICIPVDGYDDENFIESTFLCMF